jgi:transcriptional regulator with XRE-family HTH domain
MEKAIHGSEHQRLCALLRAYRERAGLRQTDVAQKLDVPQSFVSKYESGERRLDLIELRQVCRVLNVSLAEFVAAFESEDSAPDDLSKTVSGLGEQPTSSTVTDR